MESRMYFSSSRIKRPDSKSTLFDRNTAFDET